VSGRLLSSPAGGSTPVLATERVLPVPELLAAALPGAGLRRGGLVGISGAGGMTLLLSLLAQPIAQGSWAAVVGVPDLGLEAAAALGVDLTRVALVPDPDSSWPTAVAVLLDALDVVAVRPPRPARSGEAHRLAARARERGSVLLVAGGGWPERPDLELTAEVEGWEGLGAGVGTLRRRAGRITVSGRRGAGRPLTVSCWLPGAQGRLAPRPAAEPEGRSLLREVGEATPVAWAG